MSSPKSPLTLFRTYFSFRGRATRSEYWTFVGLFTFIVTLGWVCSQLELKWLEGAIVNLIWVLCIPSWAILVRRIHDVGRSGWVIFWTNIAVAAVSLLKYVFQDIADGQFIITSSLRDTRTFIDYVEIGLFLLLGLYWSILLLSNSHHGPNKYGLNPKGLGNDPEAIANAGLACTECGGLVEVGGYRVWQFIVAVALFPFGLFFFLAGRKPPKCSNCGAISAVKL